MKFRFVLTALLATTAFPAHAKKTDPSLFVPQYLQCEENRAKFGPKAESKPDCQQKVSLHFCKIYDKLPADIQGSISLEVYCNFVAGEQNGDPANDAKLVSAAQAAGCFEGADAREKLLKKYRGKKEQFDSLENYTQMLMANEELCAKDATEGKAEESKEEPAAETKKEEKPAEEKKEAVKEEKKEPLGKTELPTKKEEPAAAPVAAPVPEKKEEKPEEKAPAAEEKEKAAEPVKEEKPAPAPTPSPESKPEPKKEEPAPEKKEEAKPETKKEEPAAEPVKEEPASEPKKEEPTKEEPKKKAEEKTEPKDEDVEIEAEPAEEPATEAEKK